MPIGPQKPTVLAAPQRLCRLLEDKLLEINTIPQTHQMQIHGAAGIRLTGWGAGGPVLPGISPGTSTPIPLPLAPQGSPTYLLHRPGLCGADVPSKLLVQGKEDLA